MISFGPFILIAGISIVILLCWAWAPFAILAKLFRLGGHRKKDTGLLPLRAAAGEVRYRAEGFVPPPQALCRDPRAFDPQARNHSYLKADPRKLGQRFRNREAEDAYEATFALGRASSRQQRRKAAGSPGVDEGDGVQRPAATLDRDRERWLKLHGHLEAQQCPEHA